MGWILTPSAHFACTHAWPNLTSRGPFPLALTGGTPRAVLHSRTRRGLPLLARGSAPSATPIFLSARWMGPGQQPSSSSSGCWKSLAGLCDAAGSTSPLRPGSWRPRGLTSGL
jgi:hypothetical protein